MTKNNQHMTMILIGTIIAVAVILIGWVGSSVWNRAVAEKEEAILIAKLDAKARAEQAILNKTFEDILNTLLISVKQDTDSYKKDRKVLRELIRPDNMMKPEFVAENYAIMQRLVPSMRGKMDEIMLGFERADAQVKLTLSEIDEDTAIIYLAEWSKMKDVHLRSYIDFFGFEEQLITAYAKTLNFFQEHGAEFSYDPQSDSLVSDDPALKAEEESLRALIKTISQEQAEALTKPPVGVSPSEE